MKKLKYDYSELDKFLCMDIKPRSIARDFYLMNAGLANVLSQVVYLMYIDDEYSFQIGDKTTEGIHDLMRFFELIEELEKGGKS